MKLRRSIILANLTAEEYARFDQHPFPYSGATGAGAKPEQYNGLAPYIATFRNELRRAKRVLGWHHIKEHQPGVFKRQGKNG